MSSACETSVSGGGEVSWDGRVEGSGMTGGRKVAVGGVAPS